MRWPPGCPSRGATGCPGARPAPQTPRLRRPLHSIGPRRGNLTPRPSPGDEGKPPTASPRGAWDPRSPSPARGPAPPRPAGQWAPGPRAAAPPPRGKSRPGKVCAETGREGTAERVRDAAAREEEGEDERPPVRASGPEHLAPPPGSPRRPQRQPPAPVAARDRPRRRAAEPGAGAPCHLRARPHASGCHRPGTPRILEHLRRGGHPKTGFTDPAPRPRRLPAFLKAARPDPGSRHRAATGHPAPHCAAEDRLEACPAHRRLGSGDLRGRPGLAPAAGRHHVRAARGQRHLRPADAQQPGDHPGGDVHLRGGGQPGGHRGAVQVAQGAEGDDLLHAGVRAGRHRPAGHAAGEPGDHRHVREGRVAGRRGAVRVQHLHPALLRPVGPQHHLRHEHRALPGHQPRLFLQPLRGQAAGRPHALRRLRVQRALLRAAQHGPGQLAAAVPGHLVLHRLDHQRDGARRLLLHVRRLQLLPHPRHRALQRAGVRRAAPHAPPVHAPHLAGHGAAPRGRRLRLRLLRLLRRRLGLGLRPGPRRPQGVPGRRLARPAAPQRLSPPPELPPHRGRRDPDGHLAHRHLPGGAHLLHPARGASVHQPVISAELGARDQQKPGPAGHPNRLREPHPGPLDLHPPAEDSAQQSHGEDQMPLLPHRRVGQGPLGAALLGQQADLLRPVRPLALLPVPGAEGDQQHVADSPVHAGPRRRGPGRQEPAAGGAWHEHEPAPSRHHLPEDSADIRDLGLLAGPGLRERLAGGRGCGRCRARPQGQLPASHIPQRDTELIREVYIGAEGRSTARCLEAHKTLCKGHAGKHLLGCFVLGLPRGTSGC